MNTDRIMTQLRWDRADRYFYSTQISLQPILSELIDNEKDSNFNVTCKFIDSILTAY